jgi:chromosome segregation ATPase
MGRDQDSVFVDNERTARDAITYLKDQKVPSMTFVPLATCKVRVLCRLGSLECWRGIYIGQPYN